MKLYKHFLHEINTSPDPKRTIEELQRIVIGTIEDGPTRVGLMFGAAYIGALMDYQNPKGLILLSDFQAVRDAMDLELEQARQDFELTWALWRKGVDGE